MKAHIAAGLMLTTVSVASCGGSKAVEIDPSTAPVQNRWNGTVSSPPELTGVSEIRGNAWMGPDAKNADRTRAEVSIANAVPGGKHPWHVHRGRCGSDQGIFGPADAYEPLEVGGNGKAVANAELPVAPPKTGEFFVNVHASSRNMSTIVACGNLAPPAQ